MAARRYEISLRVLKNISRVSAANEWNIFQHKKRNFVSPSGHVMFYLLYKHQWNANHFTLTFFPVTIATVMFSHVKITCYFHMWRYHVFARKLTWYFIGIYMIKLVNLFVYSLNISFSEYACHWLKKYLSHLFTRLNIFHHISSSIAHMPHYDIQILVVRRMFVTWT